MTNKDKNLLKIRESFNSIKMRRKLSYISGLPLKYYYIKEYIDISPGSTISVSVEMSILA